MKRWWRLLGMVAAMILMISAVALPGSQENPPSPCDCDHDEVGPVWDHEMPGDTTVGCGEVPPVPDVSATDDCSGVALWEFSEESELVDCPYREHITRTWVAIDDCGNTTTWIQNIWVIDRPPEITCHPSVVVYPIDDLSPEVTGYPDISDDCGTWSLDYSDGEIVWEDECYGSFDRTWIVIDGCGNQATCVQDIRVVRCSPCICALDWSGPMPQNQEICDSESIPCIPDVSVVGNCGEVKIDFTEREEYHDEYYLIIRKFVATDSECDSIEYEWTIKVSECGDDTPTPPPCNCPPYHGGCGNPHPKPSCQYLTNKDVQISGNSVQLHFKNRPDPVGKKRAWIEVGFEEIGNYPGGAPLYGVPRYTEGDDKIRIPFTQWKKSDGGFTVTTMFDFPGLYQLVVKGFVSEDDWWYIDCIMVEWAAIPSEVLFVDEDGKPVKWYTEEDLVYVKVVEWSQPDAVMLQNAIEIDTTYDVMASEVPGTFLSGPLDLNTMAGDTLTVTYTDPNDPKDTNSATSKIVDGDLDVVKFLVGPSPFDDETTFSYAGSGVPIQFSVKIYDLSGHLVWAKLEIEVTEIVWDGTNDNGDLLANGSYIYVIEATDGKNTFDGKGLVFINR